MNHSFSTEVRVRYQETDQMGIVHHSNYLNWFEIGRTEMLRHYGVGYRDVEGLGLMLPVMQVTLNYHKSALYDDVVEVQTRLLEYTGVKLKFGYSIIRHQDVLVTGETLHCWTNKELKPVQLKKYSPELLEILKKVWGFHNV